MNKGDVIYFREPMGTVRKAEVLLDHVKTLVVVDPRDPDYPRVIIKQDLISEQEYLTSAARDGLGELAHDIMTLRSSASNERLIVLYNTLKEAMKSLNKKDGEEPNV